jgi:RND family efflux transporter MFP subunit
VQGNVESEQNVLVQPEMSGTIIKKFVEEGQDIAKGQPIAELDVEPLKRQIEELEKRIELAQTFYERQANLWNQKIGTEIQYLQAKNNLESLQKSLDVLKANKDKAVVRAPISGTVDNFLANVGEMANPAMPFCRIVNLASVKIEAEVSETYIKSVKKGDIVKVSFPNLNLEMPVKIEQIGQFINPQNRTFKIKMGINNQDRSLRPNSMAVVKIKNFDKANSVVVPTQIIQQTTEGKSFLFVVRQENGKNIIKKLNITTGMSYQGNTLVEEGLQAGDLVVIKGYNEVIDGEEVGVAKNS